MSEISDKDSRGFKETTSEEQLGIVIIVTEGPLVTRIKIVVCNQNG